MAPNLNYKRVQKNGVGWVNNCHYHIALSFDVNFELYSCFFNLFDLFDFVFNLESANYHVFLLTQPSSFLLILFHLLPGPLHILNKPDIICTEPPYHSLLSYPSSKLYFIPLCLSGSLVSLYKFNCKALQNQFFKVPGFIQSPYFLRL